MIISEVIFVLILTAVLTAIFAGACRRCGPWDNLMIFFIVLFLSTLGMGLWVRPFGPVIFGFYWMPFLIIALIVALFLAAMTSPPKPPKTAAEVKQQIREEAEKVRTINAFFWVLLVVLALTIISGYLLFRPL